MFGHDHAEGYLTHLKNSNRYYGTSKGQIILEDIHKLWKHHAAHIREIYQRKQSTNEQINKDNAKFKTGQPVMVKNHACYTFEPEYIMAYKVLKYLTTAHFANNTKWKRKRNI